MSKPFKIVVVVVVIVGFVKKIKSKMAVRGPQNGRGDLFMSTTKQLSLGFDTIEINLVPNSSREVHILNLQLRIMTRTVLKVNGE